MRSTGFLHITQDTQKSQHSLYHMCIEFLFAVDVGCASSKLQQLVGLVHDQRGVELTQPQQVTAEHPAETVRNGWSE